eukprot:5294516-Amphidinium_carterae.1
MLWHADRRKRGEAGHAAENATTSSLAKRVFALNLMFTVIGLVEQQSCCDAIISTPTSMMMRAHTHTHHTFASTQTRIHDTYRDCCRNHFLIGGTRTRSTSGFDNIYEAVNSFGQPPSSASSGYHAQYSMADGAAMFQAQLLQCAIAKQILLISRIVTLCVLLHQLDSSMGINDGETTPAVFPSLWAHHTRRNPMGTHAKQINHSRLAHLSELHSQDTDPACAAALSAEDSEAASWGVSSCTGG